MIPPMLMTPIAKIVAAGLFFASIWGWGFLVGKQWVQDEWDAAVTQQALQSAKQVLAEAKMSNDVLKAHADVTRAAEAQVEPIEREVIRYVQAPTHPCSVDPEFVRLFDELSRLPGLAPDRLSTPASRTGEPVEPPATGITTTEVLQAYYAAIDELMFLWLDYEALVQWERGRYIVQQAQREAYDH